MEHFKTYGAVMLFLRRVVNGKCEYLLQQRYNTGYADGMWDCGASGHVDEGESMKSAMIREAKEELGIELSNEDVHFATFIHKAPSNGKTYYNAYFYADKYIGTPSIMEPKKCSALQWFHEDKLPDNLINDRKNALQNLINNIPYSEFGWSSTL